MSSAYDALAYNIDSCTDSRPANVYFWDGEKPEDFSDAYWDQMNNHLWENMYLEASIECFEDFDDEDWKKLLQELPGKSLAWQKRIEDCMVEAWGPRQIEVLLLLAKTDDVELFARVMGDILEYGADDADGIDEVYEKAERMAQRPDGTRIWVLDFYIWQKKLVDAGCFHWAEDPESGVVAIDRIRDAHERAEGVIQGAEESRRNSLRSYYWSRTIGNCVHGPEDEDLVLALLEMAATEKEKQLIFVALRSRSEFDDLDIGGMDKVYEEAEKLLRSYSGPNKAPLEGFLKTRQFWGGLRIAAANDQGLPQK